MGQYYVITGTRQEYNDFIIKKAKELFSNGVDVSLSHFVYVSSEDILRGVYDPTGWLYGSWRERTDIKILLIILMTCKKGYSDVTALEKIFKELK
jgi:hypothetical protein